MVKSKKVLIVGGVAGGATAAARARRLDESAEIVLFERGDYISFANCGLPYYIGGPISERDDLLVTTPDKFSRRYRIDIRLGDEVTAIDRHARRITVRNRKSRRTYREDYDTLILSPGAVPVKPPLPGIESERIFTIRTIPDTDKLKDFLDSRRPKRAVVVGGGFIGLEMTENLKRRGLEVILIELADQVLPSLDPEMAAAVHDHLKEQGVELRLGTGVTGFADESENLVVMTSRMDHEVCDLAVLSIGVRPENELARAAGLAIGAHGGIQTDAAMRTSDPHIYAVGDAAEVTDFVGGKPVLIPLAGPANKQGRIAADNAMGRTSIFRGTQGTSIVKLFDLTAASTGASETSLKRDGTAHLVSYTDGLSHASYYPGAEVMLIKLLFSPGNGRLLGAQIVGGRGVDKRIDVLATAIRGEMSVFDLEELELAYAPPYSSAKDPVNLAGYHAANILKGDVKIADWRRLKAAGDDTVILDVRTEPELETDGTIPGAVNIPIDQLRDRLGELDHGKTYILVCLAGLRSYLGCRILSAHGYECLSVSGGYMLCRHLR